MAKRIIVCGAGLAGLNAARNLVNLGFEVEVLEKEAHVGGRVTTDYVDGFTLDLGFQVVNPKYSELRRTGILRQLELASLPKGVDLRIGTETFRIGDFRKSLSYLSDDLRGSTGALRDKLEFVKYLLRPTQDITFGEAAANFPSFFELSLKPFLDGVFLSDSNLVSNRVARDLIGWFLKGSPSLVSGGIAELPKALSAGLSIRHNVIVEKVTANAVTTSSGAFEADAVVVALDPISSSKILDLPKPEMNRSTTWYFKIGREEIESDHLRVGGIGPITNSLVLSNLLPSSAPVSTGLLQATTLIDSTESTIRQHLSYIWDRDTSKWEVIARYEIPNALPFHAPGKGLIESAKLANGVFVAGDWRNIPAQQGALLSGRLAARAVSAQLSAR